jgi:hypothetical protein
MEEDRLASNTEINLKIHERTARSYAYNYFNSKYDPTGSGTAYITDLSISFGAAEEVSGWEGRYRMTGTASFRYFQSAGVSMSQGSRNFEITTEQKGRECKVIDITLK